MTWLLFALLVVVQTLDVSTTLAAIGKGGEEANFLPHFLFARFGFWPTCIGLKVVVISVGLAVTVYVSNAYWFTGTLDLFGLAVLVNNWRVLRSL